MKKYMFGLFAIAFALGTVAFTNRKANEKDFRFNGSTSVQSQVNDPHQWSETTNLTCTGGDVQACIITDVPDTYYHASGSTFVLNNASDATGGDLQMSISSTLNGSTYYVSSIPTGSGSQDNKQ